ncbi:MAG: hypothetical protein JWN98_636 [Abditibacteriota bacterium]|nr:hypothetical protein [Abditibacteriota bacterium]
MQRTIAPFPDLTIYGFRMAPHSSFFFKASLLDSQYFGSSLKRGGAYIACAAAIGATQSTLVPVRAQNATTTAVSATAASIEAEITRGAAFLEARDNKSLDILSAASQASLQQLITAGGQSLLTVPPDRIPESGPLSDLTRRAALAHFWWGKAADTFARQKNSRDIAITALTRAYRLAGPNRFESNRLSRDAVFLLKGILREGLPSVASDDTIDTLSSLALWKPHRFAFRYNTAAFNPVVALPARLETRSVATPAAYDLLVTQGTLFPPESALMQSGDDKAVVAPLHRRFTQDRLPAVLKLTYMVAGYARETSGPNRSLWRQVVRVYYSHPILTRNNRDDRARAELLAMQFLKLHTLARTGLGLDNPYTDDGVTTLWLSEVSALWPADDDDPDVQQEIGIRMPKANVPLPAGQKPPAEVEWSALSMPWLAAGQVESAPGDIMFFKMTQPRSEAEWLREIAHEYGHVALPPFGGFRAPLEPYGNGEIGETLGAMWALAAAAEFDVSAPTPVQRPALISSLVETPSGPAPAANAGSNMGSSAAASRDGVRSGVVDIAKRELSLREMLQLHVAREAIPALRLWNAQGPHSPLRLDGTRNGLKYLQGLGVHIERVYGARVLGAACRPLVRRSATSFATMARVAASNTDALLDALRLALRDPFPSGSKYFPIWLPGAVETLPPNLPAGQFINRATLMLRPKERIGGWLYMPPAAKTLRIEWKAAPGKGLRAEGWNATTRPPLMAGASGALEMDITRRDGWQRWSLIATGEATIMGAWFERDARTEAGREAVRRAARLP